MEVTLEYMFVLQKQGTHNTQQEYTVPIPASTLWLIHGVLNALLWRIFVPSLQTTQRDQEQKDASATTTAH